MTDYGHDLLLGSFLTPAAADPQHVMDLARLSEEVGLDLVTFQDHPYQPAFLDTWTLLSWVAARTDRIRLAPNVTNLPLRPPAVLARSVATLDRLSGGRVELGLGTGAFWDAIEAMGGRRLSPGQAVDALTEAIAVIHALWAVDDRSRLDLRGTYYSLSGAKRGPAPAHAVGIWLGAYKPRMLRLTGATADGWLPSWGYLRGKQALADANARIDDAAREAGREPAAVRRLLNISGSFGSSTADHLLSGPPGRWVDGLATLTLEHGISGFVLGSDDPATLTTFGREVAPALRELVAVERAGREA